MGRTRHVQASLDQLRGMNFIHLETAVDPSACDTTGTVCGYSEWMTADTPSASLGWDWTVSLQTREVNVRLHSLRTNIQVRDDRGEKLDHDTNGVALQLLISTLPWQQQVRKIVSYLHTMH